MLAVAVMSPVVVVIFYAAAVILLVLAALNWPPSKIGLLPLGLAAAIFVAFWQALAAT